MDISEEKIDPIYTVFFEDGTSFTGGSFEAPKWGKCPTDKKIKMLELSLPNEKDKIKLENYEKYNFFIGARRPLNGRSVVLGHMYGLGCKGGVVTSYRVTLVSSGGNKYKIGDITARKFPFGKEGVGRTSTSGWKQGTGK